MKRLFGTDGIRGIANDELTPCLALEIGKATAAVVKNKDSHKPKILLGTDTRVSGDMIISALSAGLCSVGADVFCCGVITTPGIAFLVSKGDFDAAIMISASHNSYEYNGIKIFGRNGYKLSDEAENRIESIVLDSSEVITPAKPQSIGKITGCEDIVVEYTDYLKKIAGSGFDSYRILADCSNGSASVFCKKLFGAIGCFVDVINDEPDGLNINKNCGSTHANSLSVVVKNGDYDCGFAFDGDADRLIATDENGNIIDGDTIIAICAGYMKSNNTLNDNTVVATVMSNIGLKQFCDRNNIGLKITDVGDRSVLEQMINGCYNLGGEQSGHIIFSDYATTGDGLLTAVELLKIMKETGKKLSVLAKCINIFPQITTNVTLISNEMKSILSDKTIIQTINDAKERLGENGRVLVRASGTEPLIRITVQSDDIKQTEKTAKEIADIIRLKLR